jgi:crotonobetainyl-CoA:carnitine CoA-transferase CaiB-like acyl-CoA transferase
MRVSKMFNEILSTRSSYPIYLLIFGPMRSFEGLKILELAGVLAGPSVGMFFAELGASVIKIENANTAGDVTRSWKLPSESAESPVSAYFSSVNYKKTYLHKSLRNPSDLDEVLELARDADIIIANFLEGSAEKYSLDYESLKSFNPGLIYCHLRGYVADRKRPAYDVVLQAETGWMSMNGEEGGEPLKMPVALMDLLAAHHMKQSILIALYERSLSGQGAYIECSLEGSSVSNLANQASNYLMTGEVPKSLGSLHPNIAPYGETFVCGDGKRIVLAIGSDRQFMEFCSILGTEHLVIDERFDSNQSRVINRIELYNLLQDIFPLRSGNEWVSLFDTHNVPAGLIHSIDEVFEKDSLRELVRDETIEGNSTSRVTSLPFSITFNKT